MWTLLIWIFASDPTGGVSMGEVRGFNHPAACEIAAEKVRQQNPAFNTICLRVR